MHADSASRLVIVLAATVLCFLSVSIGAECVRWKPLPRSPNVAPDLDGPGSFGELQDTVTLDCLKYVGSIQKNGIEHVLIRDERGKVHLLGRGSYMGENTGVITNIDAEFIYIHQVINRNGQWIEVVVTFPKHTDEK